MKRSIGLGEKFQERLARPLKILHFFTNTLLTGIFTRSLQKFIKLYITLRCYTACNLLRVAMHVTLLCATATVATCLAVCAAS